MYLCALRKMEQALADSQSLPITMAMAQRDTIANTPLFLSEIWLEGHWGDAHIQESHWYDFKADFSLLNGRVYPDTLLPNSPLDGSALTQHIDNPRPMPMAI